MEMFKEDIQKQGNALSIVLGALLLFCIVFRIPSEPGTTRLAFVVIMEIALSLALASVIWFYNKYMALFLVMATFSTFYPVYGPASFYAQKAVFGGFLWYFLVIHFTNDTKYLLNAICYGALLNLIVQTIQVFGVQFIVKTPVPTGLMANPNETSALYIFALPAFFRDKWIVGILPILAGIYLSDSMTGWVCIIVGAYVWLMIDDRYLADTTKYLSILLLTIAIGVGVIILFNHMPTSLKLRIEVWKGTFPILKRHWFLGAGLGHWKQLFYGKMPGDGKWWMTAHNEYYQLWAEMGIIPIILLAGYLMDIRKRITIDMPRMVIVALVMILVNCVANFPWHIAPLAMIMLTWMAILEINLKNVKLFGKQPDAGAWP